MNITFFGECMVELSGQPLQRTFGGDTLNTALYLSRLGRSRFISVGYATALGIDAISQEMLNAWQAERINTSLVRRIENKLPGLYLVETEESGERHFHYWRNDSAAKYYFSDGETPLELAVAEGKVDALYISGISLAILADGCKSALVALLEEHKANGGKVIFDNNYRSQLWSVEDAQQWYSQVLPLVDIALITEEDDHLIWGEEEPVVDRCKRLGCEEVVVKRGSEPCQIVTGLQTDVLEMHLVAANKVEKVVDTCAAGDSFAAGYLAGRLMGNSATLAAEIGHKLASVVIQHPGAIIPSSEMKELM